MTTEAQGLIGAAARRIGFAETGDTDLARQVPIEAPVAIEYNGIAFAVMMATPIELEAFAVGLTLAEGLVERASEIEDISAHAVAGGWIVRVTIPGTSAEKIIERVRTRVSESSCGLCGIESIEEALRPLPRVTSRISVTREAIATALARLSDHQPLGRASGGCHVAAFCAPDGGILFASEDVGRHNALDKVVGTLALAGHDPASGFLLLSARCSYELVEKAVRGGFPMLVTISVPTSLAVERAKEAGLLLISLARSDSALIFNDPEGRIQ